MRIGIPAEVYPGETRVAATPETVKKLTTGGRHTVVVQTGAGLQAAVRDSDYEAAGATIAATAGEAYQSDIVLKVRGPVPDELPLVRRGSLVIGLLSPHEDQQALAQTGATAFAMELLPRISRAQAMDSLSSMASIAGYRAVILAADALPR